LEEEQAGIGFEREWWTLDRQRKSKSVFLFLPQYILPPFPSKNVSLRAIVETHDHQGFIADYYHHWKVFWLFIFAQL
jgi:hypothetical protein